MTLEVIVAFLGVALLAYITPGPDWFVILRHTGISRTAGVTSALGVQTGLAVHMAAAAAGVTAIITTSATAFTILKFAGAGYLVFLGIQSLRHARRLTQEIRDEKDEEPMPKPGHSAVYWRSLTANVLNPKAALFFAAILPQFVTADDSVLRQVLILGFLDIALGILWWAVFIYGITRVKKLLDQTRSRQIIDRVSGSALIILGGALALTDPPRQ